MALSNDIISRVKKALYDGIAQDVIARTHGISQPTVSRIKRGLIGPFVAWPDGSIGALPGDTRKNEREDALALRSWSPSTMRFLGFPDDMREAMFDAVNARRARNNSPLIPEEAPALSEFLASAPGTVISEELLSEAAFRAEDERMSRIMLEFDDLVAQAKVEEREKKIFDVFRSTERPSSFLERASVGENLEYNKVPWERVLETGANLALVRKVLLKRDPILLEAVCITFASGYDWGDPSAETHARKVASLLEEHPTVALRIRKENAKYFANKEQS